MNGNLTDLLSQIKGLLLFTCGAGIIWVFLMVWISRRNAERKRRAQAGLPPLPGLNQVFVEWLRKLMYPKSAEALLDEPRSSTASSTGLGDFVPTPDLSMLLSDMSEPPASPAPKPEPVKSVNHAQEEPVYMPSTEQSVPVDPRPRASSTTPQGASAGAPPDSVELLRVWRDMPTGALIIEINGRRFETISQIRGSDLERRFISVMRELTLMLQHARSEAAQPPAAPAPAPAPARIPSRPPSAPPAPAQEPPSMSAGAVFRQMGRAAMGQTPAGSEERPSAPMTIADQIEALLQARLVNLPSYSRRTIHVRPSIGGGVKIEVDGQFYDGVGDVTDSDVRELLMDVVKEWESQQ